MNGNKDAGEQADAHQSSLSDMPPKDNRSDECLLWGSCNTGKAPVMLRPVSNSRLLSLHNGKQYFDYSLYFQVFGG